MVLAGGFFSHQPSMFLSSLKITDFVNLSEKNMPCLYHKDGGLLSWGDGIFIRKDLM